MTTDNHNPKNTMTIMTMISVILSFLFFTSHLSSSSSSSSSFQLREDLPSNQWYKKYDFYPDYCSTPSELKLRTIPPLHHNNDNRNKNPIQSKIIHVTAIIRHGTRTPSKAHQCWNGFWSSNSDTAYWNCELRTMIAPPSSKAIKECQLHPNKCMHYNDEEDEKNSTEERLDGEGTMFLFEKRYDAFLSDSDDSLSSNTKTRTRLKNVLNGTCQLGQLLLRGYEQELHNGRMLRQTYIKSKNRNHDDNDDDDSMVLFDLTTTTTNNGKRPYEEPHLYYRADDDQRTLMSGSILLRGLFGDLLLEHSQELSDEQYDPTIVLHTADRSRDVLSPDGDNCPRLREIEEQVMKSEEYKALFVNSDESKILDQLMEKELGGNFRNSAKDCLMSTICTDRQLPAILNDYGKTDNSTTHSIYGSRLFDRLQKYSYLPKNFVMTHNDGAYAKLASGPLWIEILSNIYSFVQPSTKINDLMSNYLRSKLKNDPPKLSLFSAHDGTLHMLLASLGSEMFDGQDWAPFASYFVIELHDIIRNNNNDPNINDDVIGQTFPTGKAFRMIYNGKVLTSKLKGCSDEISTELCDISVLLIALENITQSERSCERISKQSYNDHDDNLINSNILYHPPRHNILISIIISFVSGCLGSFATFMYMNKKLVCCDRRGQRYETFSKNDVDIVAHVEIPDIS